MAAANPARALLERIADNVEATNTQFMADYENAGHGISARMSGETAAVLVAERSQLVESIRRAIAALPADGPTDAEVRVDERAKIAWWLKAGLAGPASVTTPGIVQETLSELARILVDDPDRWHGAPGTLERT